MPITKPIYEGVTPLPIDSLGSTLQIYHLNSQLTSTITCTSKNTVYVQSSPIAKTTKTFPTYTNNTTTNSGLVFTSKHAPAPSGKDIRIMIKDTTSTDGSVVVNGNDIVITPATATKTAAGVKALVDASAAALALVSVAYNGTGAVAPTCSDTNYFYLNGYDPGMQPVTVRIVMNYDGHIGTYPESHNTTPTASMPIFAKVALDMLILPGQLISAKSGTDGAICSITPFYKY